MRMALYALVVMIAGAAGYYAAYIWVPEVPPKPPIPRGGWTDLSVPQTAIPERVPDLELPDLEGHMHPISEWRGRPLLINFWATWCEPCRREIPLLASLHAQASPRGLQVLGIAVDFRDEVARYAKAVKLPYTTLVADDDSSALRVFGVGQGLPASVFADSQGRIVTVKTGELRPAETDLIVKLIKRVDAGRITLPAAQAQIAAELRHLSAN